jgi:endonuclease-3
MFVAALLSAQCADAQVNRATAMLFKRFRSFRDYAESDPRTLRSYLSGLNYYKTKARHLREASRIIVSEFGGRVPRTMKDLLVLPGVGRKVANVILSECFGINEGIAVDTHVTVTAGRLQLSRSKDPKKIEQDLMGLIDRKDWGRASNLLIELGRDTCKARKKECFRCSLCDVCPSSDGCEKKKALA